MKKTHRILALLLSLCLVVSLDACSGGTGAGTPETSAPETSAPETAAPSTGDATSISLWCTQSAAGATKPRSRP